MCLEERHLGGMAVGGSDLLGVGKRGTPTSSNKKLIQGRDWEVNTSTDTDKLLIKHTRPMRMMRHVQNPGVSREAKNG